MTEPSGFWSSYPVVFWQSSLSIHQTPLLEQFAKDWKSSVFLVVDQRLPKQRVQESGWRVTAPNGVVVSTSGSEVPGDALHIVSGFSGPSQWKKNLRRIKKSPYSQIWVLAESLQTEQQPLKGLLRLARHGLSRILLNRHLTGFLAIGESAAVQGRMLGISSAKIFPFCYVTSAKTNPTPITSAPDPRASVLYVGRISRSKGVDILVRSINWEQMNLQLIGQKSDSTLEIPAEATYLGIKDNEEVSSYIEQADVLVLPSRYDGWGAVVNEALMAGTPVVCTDACGAATLVWGNSPYRGEVISKLTAENLSHAIDKVLSASVESEEIKKWSIDSIAAEPVSAYLRAILLEGNPEPPWLTY